MIIRQMTPADANKLKEIHEQQYAADFEFPHGKFIMEFVVVDDDNKVISGGGVRSIAESVIITDKCFSPRIRREALLEILNASLLTCGKFGYDQLHAFVKDPTWEKVLEKYDFKLCKNLAYYRNV